MRIVLLLAALVAVAVAIMLAGDPVIAWASGWQRRIQNDLALALAAARRGDAAAMAGMIAAGALYGVLHAIGPGHGKMLIGGAALASRRTARHMAALGLVSSLVQGVTAIVLVYGGLGALSLGSRALIRFSETWLTAASHGAIALVGLWLLWRGGRLALRLARSGGPPALHRPEGRGQPDHDVHHHHHSDACEAGCRHLPDLDAMDRVDSWRDAAALVLSIGLRPCSGALIVLALAWRYELYAIGLAATLAMALGTGVVVAAIALLAVRLREVGPSGESGAFGLWSLAAAQLAVGVVILVVGLASAVATLRTDAGAHPLAARETLRAVPPVSHDG